MTQNTVYTRRPGIRLTVDGARVGAVYALRCPALRMDTADRTPLNGAWRVTRPTRRYLDGLRLTALLRPSDPGQARLLAAYRQSAPVACVLTLSGGEALAWTGYVSSLALSAGHPEAAVSLEAEIQVSGEAEVSA